MRVETLEDALEWARRTHVRLAGQIERDLGKVNDERAQMLLTYLAKHERTLSETLEMARHDASPAALHTWCYEYFENAPSHPESHEASDFRELAPDAIMRKVLAEHEHIGELFRYLRDQVETPTAHELIDNLVSLEEHETMRLVRDAERMEDL